MAADRKRGGARALTYLVEALARSGEAVAEDLPAPCAQEVERWGAHPCFAVSESKREVGGLVPRVETVHLIRFASGLGGLKSASDAEQSLREVDHPVLREWIGLRARTLMAEQLGSEEAEQAPLLWPFPAAFPEVPTYAKLLRAVPGLDGSARTRRQSRRRTAPLDLPGRRRATDLRSFLICLLGIDERDLARVLSDRATTEWLAGAAPALAHPVSNLSRRAGLTRRELFAHLRGMVSPTVWNEVLGWAMDQAGSRGEAEALRGVEHLREIGGPRAVQTLSTLLFRDSRAVQLAAAKALIDLGDDGGIAAVEALGRTADPDLRSELARHLAASPLQRAQEARAALEDAGRN